MVLVGAPGSGKTTVGQALAERLGVEFRDTDTDIETAAGESISDIFVVHGEAAFRTLETAAVADALAEHTGVLALGGGAVLDPITRQRLADHRVAWLRVGLHAAASRAGLSVARPLLLGNVRATMKGLLDARNPVYAEVATMTVDTDGRAVDEVVTTIADSLRDPA